MNFRSQFKNPPNFTPEHYTEGFQTSVEQGGYLTTEQLVNDMNLAGQRLDLYKHLRYDAMTLEDADRLDIDPTRYPGIDPAEITQMVNYVKSRIAKHLDNKMEKAPAVPPAPPLVVPPVPPPPG